MLAQLTAVEADQVATKDFVRAEISHAVNRLLTWMITFNLAQIGLILTLTRKG